MKPHVSPAVIANTVKVFKTKEKYYYRYLYRVYYATRHHQPVLYIFCPYIVLLEHIPEIVSVTKSSKSFHNEETSENVTLSITAINEKLTASLLVTKMRTKTQMLHLHPWRVTLHSNFSCYIVFSIFDIFT